MNPLKNSLGNMQITQGVEQVKGLMNQMKAFSNPQLALQQMAQNNPQLNQVLQMCNGKNPKQVFMSMCKDRGIDPNSILSMLK